jgi:hypothetical protein
MRPGTRQRCASRPGSRMVGSTMMSRVIEEREHLVVSKKKCTDGVYDSLKF